MALLAGASAILLSGCAGDSQGKSRLHIADDFGQAVRADLAAQIAYPEPHWTGPMPPSNGDKAALAEDHYIKGTVIQPNITNTSSLGGGGGSGGGGSSSGGSGPQ